MDSVIEVMAVTEDRGYSILILIFLVDGDSMIVKRIPTILLFMAEE